MFRDEHAKRVVTLRLCVMFDAQPCAEHASMRAQVAAEDTRRAAVAS